MVYVLFFRIFLSLINYLFIYLFIILYFARKLWTVSTKNLACGSGVSASMPSPKFMTWPLCAPAWRIFSVSLELVSYRTLANRARAFVRIRLANRRQAVVVVDLLSQASYAKVWLARRSQLRRAASINQPLDPDSSQTHP